MTPIRYWIHGRRGSGKTELACRITHITPRNHIPGHCPPAELITRLLNSRIAVIENYRETDTKYKILMSAGLNLPINKATLGIPAKESETVQFNIDVLVVISEQPPSDAALASRFFIIELSPTDRRAHTFPESQS